MEQERRVILELPVVSGILDVVNGKRKTNYVARVLAGGHFYVFNHYCT